MLRLPALLQALLGATYVKAEGEDPVAIDADVCVTSTTRRASNRIEVVNHSGTVSS